MGPFSMGVHILSDRGRRDGDGSHWTVTGTTGRSYNSLSRCVVTVTQV